MTTTNAWNASTYQKNVSFVYNTANTAPILALLDVKEGEKVLDLACGSGELTLELERAAGQEGLIVGFDASESMVCTPPLYLHTFL
jgi:ubiquinone/menaquinone biosynthesis C-methylase UbiE